MAQYTDFFSTALIEELQIQPHGQHPQLENWLQSIAQRLYDALPPEKRTSALATCPPVFLSAHHIPRCIISNKEPAISISVGLLKLPESEDELAGIFGHEFLHPITNAELLYFNAILPNSAVDTKNNRAAEYVADYKGGVNLAADAGYRWDGLANFFERFPKEKFNIFNYFDSHPDNVSRVRQLKNAGVELSQSRVQPALTPLPTWLNAEIELIQGADAVTLWLHEHGFDNADDVSRINLIADLIEHQADLFFEYALSSRRKALGNAIRKTDWGIQTRHAVEARERLGWALLDFQYKEDGLMVHLSNNLFNLIQRQWYKDRISLSKFAQPRIYVENNLIKNDYVGTTQQDVLRHDSEHNSFFFPSFNTIKSAVHSFFFVSNPERIIESAHYLNGVLPKLNFHQLGQGDNRTITIERSAFGNFHFPQLSWRKTNDQNRDPVPWTPQILAYLQTQEPAILETLIYFGVVVDPRVPELAVLAEKMQQQAKGKPQNPFWNLVSTGDSNNLTLTSYTALILNSAKQFRHIHRPHNPGYLLNGQEVDSGRYYPELDGWQQYREAESNRLAARDHEEQALLATIDWQELRQDWHGFIHRYKHQLTPELSVCDGGWLFADRFLQEATQLAEEKPEQFRSLLQWFFMEGSASYVNNQQSHWYNISFFYSLIEDERQRWGKAGYEEIYFGDRKVTGSLASMRPQHPYNQFIIEDPLDLFSWHHKIMLLDKSSFLQHETEKGKNPHALVIAPEYRSVFSELDAIESFSELLASFPWRRHHDVLNKNTRNVGDEMPYKKMQRFYFGQRAWQAIEQENWAPQTMKEYGDFRDMVNEIDHLFHRWSEWRMSYPEGQEHKKAKSPYCLEAMHYAFEQRSPLWVQNILQKIDGLELAHAYILALELDLRRFYPAPLRQAETRLEALLTDESLSSEDKLSIAETILFNRRFTQKGTLFFYPPYDGVINAIPLRKGAEDIIATHMAGELGVDDGSREWLEKAQATLIELCYQLGSTSKVSVLEKISHLVIAQYELASTINDLCNAVKHQQSLSDHEQGCIELSLDLASQDDETADHFRNFLIFPCTRENIRKTIYHGIIQPHKQYEFADILKTQFNDPEQKEAIFDRMERLHEGFWLQRREVRAVALDRLYFPVHDEAAHAQSEEKIIELLTPSGKSKWQQPLKILLSSLEKDEKRLLLATLLAGRQPEGESFSEAKLLREICQSFPPLGPKLAQAISNHHATSEDIRAELRQTKYMAEDVSRFTILDMARKEGHEVGKNGLKLFGKLLGVGANAYALQLGKEDGSSSVLYMLKDNVLARAEIMGAKLLKTAQQLAAEDHSYGYWPEILSNALELLREELDFTRAQAKAEAASAFYQQTAVHFGEQLWSNKSTQIISMGQRSLEMSYMQGTMLAKHYEAASPLAWRAAVVSLITEFLAQGGEIGLGFERDPHDGNANLHAVNDNMVEIGQYDFFGWREEPATAEEKQALGRAMGKIILGALTGKFNLATGQLPKDHERAILALGQTLREAGPLGTTIALGTLLNAHAIPQLEQSMQQTMGMAYKPFKITACTTAKIYNIALKQ